MVKLKKQNLKGLFTKFMAKKFLAIILTLALLPWETAYAVSSVIQNQKSAIHAPAERGDSHGGHAPAEQDLSPWPSKTACVSGRQVGQAQPTQGFGGQADTDKFLGFLDVRGKEYGLVLNNGNLWHISSDGEENVLNEKAGKFLKEIITEVSPSEVDGRLAESLLERLEPLETASFDKFFLKDGEKRLKLTPLGFKTLIEKLGVDKFERVSEENYTNAAELPVNNASLHEGHVGSNLNLLQVMVKPENLGSGKFFDGADRDTTGLVDFSNAGFGESKGQTTVPVQTVSPLSKDSFKIKKVPSLAVKENVSWRPPDNHKGRIARIAGALGTGAGIGAVANLFWGPAAAAYFMTGSIMKSASYNSDVFAKVSERIKESRFIKFLGKSGIAKKIYHKALKPAWDGVTDPDILRLLLGAGLMVGGMFTGNPVMAYFGMTFGIFSAGEIVSKAVFNKTYGLLNGPTAKKIGTAIDSTIIQKAAEKNQKIVNIIRKKTGWNNDFLNKASSYVYNNRGKIAKIALAATISMGAMAGFAVGAHAALGSTLGQMTVKTGDLTFWDKAKNTLIGGYRMYNLPGTVLKNGEQTQKFYQEMKVKYDPKTPQEWANVIEKEVTWVAHNDLYGTNLYHITSEEAARVVTLNGAAGRFSDCTGKGALLYNVLKMDGFGASEVVVGIPPLGYPDKVGHIWLVGRDASGKPVELFHYSNSQHMLRSQTFQAAQGIKGDRMAAFVAGGAGGLATKGIYGLLERIEAKIKGPKRPTPQ